jgi:hypothetical protein
MSFVSSTAQYAATSEKNKTGYLLAELRCATLRARLVASDLDAIGLALKGGLITPVQALELLDDCDLFRYIEPTPPTMAP